MQETKWPTLKQFSDLGPEDFEENPIWISCHSVDYDEPWYDETDEETYRPYTDAAQINPSEEGYLINADFKLNDGTELQGFFTPQDTNDNEDSISYVQPHVFINGISYRFWFGIVSPKKQYLAKFYEGLGKEPVDVFPITYTSSNRRIKGRIDGFGHIG